MQQCGLKIFSLYHSQYISRGVGSSIMTIQDLALEEYTYNYIDMTATYCAGVHRRLGTRILWIIAIWVIYTW